MRVVDPRQVRAAWWGGRVLLLGAVAFWWGATVAPRLVSLVFPQWLPADAIPWHLDPDQDGSAANAVSAAALATAAFLAFATASKSRRQAAGWIAVGGWTTLAITTAFLAWEEIFDFHATGLTGVARSVFGGEVVEALGTYVWVLLLSPLIAAFLVCMWAFVRHGSLTPAIRTPFMLALVAWLLAVILEAIVPILAKYRPHGLLLVLEETLEFSGALLFCLSAAIALRGHQCHPPVSPRVGSIGGRWRVPLVGSMAVVVVLGSLVVVFTFRVLLIDARAVTYLDTFELRLRAQEAVVQEVRMPAYPIGRLDFRLGQRDPNRDWGVASVRITRPERPERLLAEYQVEVPTGESARWRSVDLIPPLVEPEGQRLALQLFADIAPDAELRVGVTTTNRYGEGNLWVNGTPGEPVHDLEFLAYGAPEPTRSKLQAVWHTTSSDWRWPVLLTSVAAGLTLITFIPVVLVTAACRRTWA